MIIHKLQSRHSIYEVQSHHIEKFTDLLDHHHHYKIILPEFVRGTVFHWQLAFDLFHYFSTHDYKLFLNIQQLLISPFSVHLHQLLRNSSNIKNFKTIIKPEITLLLISSLILTKRILTSIDWHIIAPSNFQNHLQNNIYHTDHEDMQHDLLIEFKQSLKYSTPFSTIAKDALAEATAMYHFIEIGEVIKYDDK